MGGPPAIAGYEGLSAVGRGGFATVYRAREVAFNRDVAIKVLDVGDVSDDARQRFERECKAIGALSGHPNIITVYGAGSTENGRPYIVMDLMEGGSLTARLKHAGAMSLSDAVRAGLDLADAVVAAHEIGIVHRDIKPDNVLISRYDRLQLGDFGISSIPGGYETTTGNVTATLGFAAPEVINGERATAVSDVYSLAATIATIAIGEPVFARKTDELLVAYINRVMSDQPRDLEPYGASPELAAVLRKGLAKQPGERYRTAAEFRQALSRVPEAALGIVEPGLITAVPEGGTPAWIPGAGFFSQPSAGVTEPEPEPGPESAERSDPLVVGPVPELDVFDADVTTQRPAPPVENSNADEAPIGNTVRRVRSEPDGGPEAAADAVVPGLPSQPEQPTGRRRHRLFGVIGVAAAAIIAVVLAVVLSGGKAKHPAATAGQATDFSSATSSGSSTPPAVAAPRAQVSCAGRSCTFTVADSLQTGETVAWAYGDGNTDTATAAVEKHTYAKPGSFTATATATVSGVTSSPAQVHVTIASLKRTVRLTSTAGSLRIYVSVSGPRSCQGSAAFELQRKAKEWKTSRHGTLPGGAKNSIAVTSTGTYRLLLPEKAVSGAVCSAVTSAPVTVKNRQPTYVYQPPPVSHSSTTVYVPPPPPGG